MGHSTSRRPGADRAVPPPRKITREAVLRSTQAAPLLADGLIGSRSPERSWIGSLEPPGIYLGDFGSAIAARRPGASLDVKTSSFNSNPLSMLSIVSTVRPVAGFSCTTR
jgi:hypothetical protein